MTDFAALGFKAGLEIHQQLKGKKLFCACPANIREDDPHFSINRKLRASVGESGKMDVAAKQEQQRNKTFVYEGYEDTTCLVELDEEPVSKPDTHSVETAVMVSELLHMTRVDEIHVMRKVVVDGSNTSAFQRTMTCSFEGLIEPDNFAPVRIDRLCLEEDSAKIVERTATQDTYNLSRLGIPLLEITTKPDITSPEHLQASARQIGMILRSTGRVKRGLGTIRQDVNISIADGSRVEIKGVQNLDLMPLIAENEVKRQQGIVAFAKQHDSFTLGESLDVTTHFKNSGGWIQKAIENGAAVIGTTLPEKLLAQELYENYRLGTELAGYAKVWGFGGLMHDGEDPSKYGLENWDSIAKAGFLLLVGDKEHITTTLPRLIERLNTLANGVPSEVRKANEDGTSSYLRPMPGSARMYPETDVRTFRIDAVKPQLPELLTDKAARLEKEFSITADLANQVARSEHTKAFEKWAALLDPSIVVDVLLVKEKELKRRHNITLNITTIADDLLQRIANGSVSKDAVEDILVAYAKTNTVDWSAYRPVDESEIKKIVQEVIDADPQAPRGALMGAAMKRLAGKADGKTVNKLLQELLG